METILCATRGGEASIRTQQHAIALAKEREAKLVFIFVADVRFLDHFSAPRVPAMEDEMRHLGEFLLLMAKERAEKEGVEADFTVREGVFSTALIEAAKDYDVTVIILGRPADEGLTTLEYLENDLVPLLREQTGCEVMII